MREWTTPKMKELKISETANGFINTEVESLILFNDSLKAVKPGTSN